MKTISKEIQLNYKNNIGQSGLQTIYNLEEKHEKINKVIMCIFFFFVICVILSVVLFATKNVDTISFYILSSISLVSFCVFSYLTITQDYELSQYSNQCIFLTELIERENFKYVSACIAIDELLKRYFILKSYDKNDNLLMENKIEIPIDYEFSDKNVASLTITNKNWVLNFPKNEINFDIF